MNVSFVFSLRITTRRVSSDNGAYNFLRFQLAIRNLEHLGLNATDFPTKNDMLNMEYIKRIK